MDGAGSPVPGDCGDFCVETDGRTVADVAGEIERRRLERLTDASLVGVQNEPKTFVVIMTA